MLLLLLERTLSTILVNTLRAYKHVFTSRERVSERPRAFNVRVIKLICYLKIKIDLQQCCNTFGVLAVCYDVVNGISMLLKFCDLNASLRAHPPLVCSFFMCFFVCLFFFCSLDLRRRICANHVHYQTNFWLFLL